MSIARRLVERMGGKIAVLSEPAKGTTFSFTLNLKQVDDATPVPAELPPMTYAAMALPTSANAAPLRILVAEDSEDNQILLEAFVAQSPHHLCFANDGASAVDMFLSESFDVVLMDVQMPVMDGLEATRRIREAERQRGHGRVPIVAITASALAHDREATAQAGCDQHLSKPLSQERMLACLSQFSQTIAVPSAAPTINDGSPIVVEIPSNLEDLVGPYLESRGQELNELNTLLTTQEFDKIRHIGRELKGTGESYGFQELTKIGIKLELEAGERSPDAIREQLIRMTDFLARVRVAVPEMPKRH
ncbi:MAG: response regulator [Acidobacteriota bacterium]